MFGGGDVMRIGVALLCCVWGAMMMMMLPAAARAAPGRANDSGIPSTNEREGSLQASGSAGRTDVDRAGVEIAVPASPDTAGAVSERQAPSSVDDPPPRDKDNSGKVDRKVFDAEILRNISEIEACRSRVAAARDTAPANIQAGKIALHWTVLPSGHTRNALVFETTPTDLALMTCVRNRMNAWVFTPPQGGAVTAAYDYAFADLAPSP